jgi:hypothetical protein
MEEFGVEATEGRLRGTDRFPCPSLDLSARDGLTVCGRSGRDPQHVALSSLQTIVRRFSARGGSAMA